MPLHEFYFSLNDLNEDLLNMNYRNLRDILPINSMQNVINDATMQNAILDPIIKFDDMPYTDCGVTDTPAHISDHKASYLFIPFHYDIQNAYTRLVWLYKRATFELLRQQITNYNWNCLSDGSLDEACTKFISVFFSYRETCIP